MGGGGGGGRATGNRPILLRLAGPLRSCAVRLHPTLRLPREMTIVHRRFHVVLPISGPVEEGAAPPEGGCVRVRLAALGARTVGPVVHSGARSSEWLEGLREPCRNLCFP